MYQIITLYTLSLHNVMCHLYFKKARRRDFPGGPALKNSPGNGEDMGSIPGEGTKILHASKQLSPHAEITWAKLGSPCATIKDPSWHN